MAKLNRFFCRDCREFAYRAEDLTQCPHCGSPSLRKDKLTTARRRRRCGACGRRRR